MDILKIDASLLMKMFVQGTLNLNKDKEAINALNVFPVPDGDTGTNMNLTMQSALTEMKKGTSIRWRKSPKPSPKDP